jgi:hypothetical protein
MLQFKLPSENLRNKHAKCDRTSLFSQGNIFVRFYLDQGDEEVTAIFIFYINIVLLKELTECPDRVEIFSKFFLQTLNLYCLDALFF